MHIQSISYSVFSFCLYLIDLVSYNTPMACLIFSDPLKYAFVGFQFNEIGQVPISLLAIP